MNTDTYVSHACERLQALAQTQSASLQAAGALMANAIVQDRLIYVYGAGGHTSLVTGEMFFRIGGFANIYPIVEYGLTALSRAAGFMQLERCGDLARGLINASGLGEDDVLLLFHTIGVNASCIDGALRAKELGAHVVGIASGFWQTLTPPDADIRHAGRQNLRDVADVWIDDLNPVDDCAVQLAGLQPAMGPLSGIGSFGIAHMLELTAAGQCLQRGVVPPVWQNANTPQGCAANEALLVRYRARIPML